MGKRCAVKDKGYTSLILLFMYVQWLSDEVMKWDKCTPQPRKRVSLFQVVLHDQTDGPPWSDLQLFE